MWQRGLMSRLGWNKLAGRKVTADDLKVDNYLKEIYLDSDTKVALLSNSPSKAEAIGCCRKSRYSGRATG